MKLLWCHHRTRLHTVCRSTSPPRSSPRRSYSRSTGSPCLCRTLCLLGSCLPHKSPRSCGIRQYCSSHRQGQQERCICILIMIRFQILQQLYLQSNWSLPSGQVEGFVMQGAHCIRHGPSGLHIQKRPQSYSCTWKKEVVLTWPWKAEQSGTLLPSYGAPGSAQEVQSAPSGSQVPGKQFSSF